MSTIYTVFNTKSETEFCKFLDKLQLESYELINVFEIAESLEYDLKTKQRKILEYLAGTARGNYELCVEQFKPKFQRVLKEANVQPQPLNLNQVMELNALIDLVASKLESPNCMKGVFNIVQSKTNANIANAFLGMVQQSQVSENNLKFNTDLVVSGQNVAQAIYPIKADIEMFANTLDTAKKSSDDVPSQDKIQESVSENKLSVVRTPSGDYGVYAEDSKGHTKCIYVGSEKECLAYIKKDKKITEAQDISLNVISDLTKQIESTNDERTLKLIIGKITNLIHTFKETDTQNTLSSIKSKAMTKLSELNNETPKIEECLAPSVVSTACGEDTFNGLLNNLRPTMISITVNNEDGSMQEDEQAQQAINALQSHIGCQKQCCPELNLEEMQTVNILIAQLAEYFQKRLNENCSAGATCAASVANVTSPIKPKKKKKKSQDLKMFEEYVACGFPATIEVNGSKLTYTIVEGKDYLYIDGQLLKTNNRQTILESIDQFYNNCLELEILGEGFNINDLEIILENEENPTNQEMDSTEQKEHEKTIETEMNTNSNLKVSVEDDQQQNVSNPNQEIVGIDDSNPNNKMYVVKDPTTGKIRVVNSTAINLQGEI